jgi:hypothetical protein
MKNTSRLLVVALVLAVFLPILPAAHAAQSGGLYLQVKGYNWKEYDGSQELLEESGPLFGIGLRLEPDPAKVSAQGRIEAYFGQVNYDGQTFDGAPIEDETAYVGMIGDLDVALPAWVDAKKKHSILLFVGGGAHIWQRDLGQENEDLGYTEEWMMFYARAGGGFYLAETGAVKAFVAGGVKVPVYTSNGVTVDDGVDTQDVTLEPKGQPGPFIEAGWRWKKYFANVFYEYILMEESDPETIFVSVPGLTTPVEFTLFQPESDVHTLGVNVGMYF